MLKTLLNPRKWFAKPNAGAIPSFCLLVLNKNCNFRCKMCNMWKHKPDDNYLTLDEMKKFVDDLASFVKEPIFIHLIGGETLLCPHLCEIARYIVDKGFRTSITTNGFLIDEKMSGKIVDSGMSGVFISLDSLKPEMHDYIRGVDGAFDRVRKAVCHLNNAKRKVNSDLSIGHTFTIMNSNLDEILQMADFVEGDNMVDSLFFNAVMQPFDSGEDSKEWINDGKHREIWPQDLKQVHRVLDELIVRARGESKICNPPEQLEVLKAYFADPYRFRHNLGIKCTRGDLALEVNAYGDVAMCFFMPPIGNIRKTSVRDLWFSEDLVNARKAINKCDKECDLTVNCFYKIENITDVIS